LAGGNKGAAINFRFDLPRLSFCLGLGAKRFALGWPAFAPNARLPVPAVPLVENCHIETLCAEL
jgi:hypothetical protein